MIKKQLAKDDLLLAELVVAKELGYTLSELRGKMTLEELWIWHAFLGLQRDEQDKAMNKSRSRR